VLGKAPLRDLVYDDLGGIVLPCDILVDKRNAEIEVPTDPRFEINLAMEAFVKRSGEVRFSISVGGTEAQANILIRCSLILSGLCA
jgi:hypothetical protein